MSQPQPQDPGQYGTGAWQPDSEVVHHCGQPLTAQDDFFCPPPSEIGTIVSAATTLTREKYPKSMGLRVGIALLIFVIIGGLAELVIYRMEMDSDDLWALRGLALGFGSLIGLIVFYATGFRQRCSYVGEQGVVEFRITGSRTRTPKAAGLQFCDVDELYTGRTRNFTNGVYTGTSYDYTWRVAGQGRPAFRLKGTYSSQEDTPKVASPYWFADSAESAWCEYRLAALTEELEANGFVEFQIGRRRAVRFGPDCLDFVTGDQVVRMDSTDVGSIKAADGTITFKHKDAKWFSGKGKFSFQFAAIPNATLFLICLDRLGGFQLD